MTRLLLHACCAPCSLEPVRLLLKEGFEPTICWTNPNIQPADEHDRRLAELRRWCAAEGIPLIEAAEDTARWEARVAPIGALRREIRKLSDIKLEAGELTKLLLNDVVKRDLIESETAKEAEKTVRKLQKSLDRKLARKKEQDGARVAPAVLEPPVGQQGEQGGESAEPAAAR